MPHFEQLQSRDEIRIPRFVVNIGAAVALFVFGLGLGSRGLMNFQPKITCSAPCSCPHAPHIHRGEGPTGAVGVTLGGRIPPNQAYDAAAKGQAKP